MNTRLRILLVSLFSVLFVGAAGSSVYFYSQYQTLKNQPKPKAERQVSDIIAAVGKLMVLPNGETPAVASVSDVTKLKGQAFFVTAKNGDEVLIYTKAKKAILYRPSVNKIIDVAPIAVDSASPAASPSQALSMKFVLLNGTTTVGLTKKYQAELVVKVTGAQVVDTDNAKKRDYTKSLLVDLTGKRASDAAAIAKTLGVALGKLPSGESATASADFLIILGSDKK